VPEDHLLLISKRRKNLITGTHKDHYFFKVNLKTSRLRLLQTKDESAQTGTWYGSGSGHVWVLPPNRWQDPNKAQGKWLEGVLKSGFQAI